MKLIKNSLLLDNYEKSIETALQKGEYVSVKNLTDSKELFAKATELYKDLQKTKRITLRVNKSDLIKVTAKAKNNRIPYQRIISALIHKYAEGETGITL